MLKCPPVESCLATIVVEAEIEVVNPCGSLYFCLERLVFVYRTSLGDDCRTDDGALLAVEV